MDSSKIKNKYFFFYLKREQPGHSHNLNKTKPNSSSINNLISAIWILSRSSGLPQGAWITSLTPPSAAHTTFFRAAQACSSPPWLPFLVVVPWHHQSPSAGVFHCGWAALVPMASPGLSSYCQSQILHMTLTRYWTAPSPSGLSGPLTVPSLSCSDFRGIICWRRQRQGDQKF